MQNRHWRVAEQESVGLSEDAQIEGVLRFGDWHEINALIKQMFDAAYTVYQTRTIHDIAISAKHKKLLSFLFSYYAQYYDHSMEGSSR